MYIAEDYYGNQYPEDSDVEDDYYGRTTNADNEEYDMTEYHDDQGYSSDGAEKDGGVDWKAQFRQYSRSIRQPKH